MTRAETLNRAYECVCKDREGKHGGAEDNFSTIARLWNAYKGDDIFDSKDVAIMMAMLKIARIRTGHGTEDSYVDACGYLSCGAELDARLEDD